MCENVCDKARQDQREQLRKKPILTSEQAAELKRGECYHEYIHPIKNKGLVTAVLVRRMTEDMSPIPFAVNYIVCRTEHFITHWVRVERILKLREKVVEYTEGMDKPKVVVLFTADNINFEITNVDIIQFLAEVKMAKEISNAQIPE